MTGLTLTHYHACYCEENAWWAVQQPALSAQPRAVIIIANAAGHALLWEQRAAPPGAPLIWDYHVVVVVGRGAAANVIDPDCRLGLVTPAGEWLRATFRHAVQEPARPELMPLVPLFRVVDGDEYVRRFGSDRSHMRAADGSWLRPPPPWDAPGDEMNLARFIDPTDDIAGDVLTLAELLARFA